MWTPLNRLLQIDLREVEFSRRGFAPATPGIQARLENVGRIFLRGYHTALANRDQSMLGELLNQIDLEHRGFAFEGAAMALALQDRLSLQCNGLHRFIDGAGRHHIYMLHVGAGWAYARLPWVRRRIETAIKSFHPVLRWLVMDGYGFHEGYFHWKSGAGAEGCVRGFPAPSLSEDARHIFFQGLGRSLWFSQGADVNRISEAIAAFHPVYHGDAWSGVGLACAYAGGHNADSILRLRQEAGKYRAAAAQGAAFAAKARQLAGNPAMHTEIACNILCGITTEKASALCDETFNKIDLHHSCPYQHWRALLQEALFPTTEIIKRGKSHESGISPLVAAQPY